MDRILANERKPYGQSLTRSGPLLKKQIPIRTFADWDDVAPGFFEADLVAHCGDSAGGRFVQTLVLTDVNTGWTEPFALLHKREDYVIAGIVEIRKILPFPLLGLDTDSGNEFINQVLTDYCSESDVVFTRGRPKKKNDQCRVEEKTARLCARRSDTIDTKAVLPRTKGVLTLNEATRTGDKYHYHRFVLNEASDN